MIDVFPALSTVSLMDAAPGSIVKIVRSDGIKLILVTAHVANGVRSFVWLNPNFKNRPAVIFAEKWQNDPAVLQYVSDVRFELGTADEELDPSGRLSWETPGVIVSIAGDLFIRAAPEDPFYGQYKLINVRNGSIYSGHPPNSLWTFLSWQLWIRDPVGDRDFMLTEFRAGG
jgi:hypothetical protein